MFHTPPRPRKHFPAPTLRWFCPVFKLALVLKLLLEIPEDLLHVLIYLIRRNDYLRKRKQENAGMKARFLATGLGKLWRR